MDNVSPRRDLLSWLLLAAVTLLGVACIALLAANAGPGITVDGQTRAYHFESAITNYPFCPPSVPCPISMILNYNVFAVWLVWETDTPTGAKTDYRRLIYIRLP